MAAAAAALIDIQIVPPPPSAPPAAGKRGQGQEAGQDSEPKRARVDVSYRYPFFN